MEIFRNGYKEAIVKYQITLFMILKSEYNIYEYNLPSGRRSARTLHSTIRFNQKYKQNSKQLFKYTGRQTSYSGLET